MFALLARFEWVLIELLVLGFLVWQLFSVIRDQRRAGDGKTKDTKPPQG